MKHIALFGGSFDPPHKGHLALAEAVYSSLKPNRVDLLVSYESPHADGKSNQANAEQRLEMATLAAKAHDWLGIEDIEHRLRGKSFSYRTISALKKAHPDNRYSFVIGGDMLGSLHHWHRINELIELVDFVPVYRKGFDERVYQTVSRYFSFDVVADIRANHIEMQAVNISSTSIRKAFSDCRKMVPEAVAEYITENKLYGA